MFHKRRFISIIAKIISIIEKRNICPLYPKNLEQMIISIVIKFEFTHVTKQGQNKKSKIIVMIRIFIWTDDDRPFYMQLHS